MDTTVLIGVVAACVVAVVILTLAVRRLWLSCKSDMSMSEQMAQPVRAGSRLKFRYKSYEEETKKQIASTEINNSFHSQSDVGYIDVIGPASSTASPSPHKSTLEAFSEFDRQNASPIKYRLPSFSGALPGHAVTPSAGLSSMMAHPTMDTESRTNPMFDAATVSAVFSIDEDEIVDDEVLIGGSDHESDDSNNEYLGFDVDGVFSSDGDGFGDADGNVQVTDSTHQAEMDFDGFSGADAGTSPTNEETLDGFGFAGGADDSVMTQGSAQDKDVLPPMSPEQSTEIDSALDLLNMQTTMEERIEGIERIHTVLTSCEGAIQECVDMNGVVSLCTVIKEEIDAQIQEKALQVLDVICSLEAGVDEALRHHIVNIWATALDEDRLWLLSLQGLSLVCDEQRAVYLMLSEGVLPRLCKRIMVENNSVRRHLMMKILVRMARSAERMSQIEGLYAALAVCLKSDRTILDDVVRVIDAGTGAFGVDAVTLLIESGLGSELQGLSSSVQAGNPELTKIVKLLDEVEDD